MRICTKLLIFLITGFLAFSSTGCQTSHGSYGNSKHHKKSSSSKSKSKSSSSKSSGSKSMDTKDKESQNSSNPKAGVKSQSGTTAPEDNDKKVSRIGYGANIGNISFYGSEFQFGIAPNIAYKLEDQLAVGFMLKLDYYYFKDSYYQLKYSAFDVGPTIFTRWKPLMKTEGVTPFMKGLFLQAEYEHASIARPYDEFGNINTMGNKIIGYRNWEDYVYVGAGTSTGYPFSTFFSIHYNILDDFQHSRDPFALRLGFTYNY